MADEADSTDHWARAVESFTGYTMPNRAGMFDDLTADDPGGNAPLLTVAIEDRDFMEMTEAAYELYSGPNIDGHDFVIHFFMPPLDDPADVDLDDYSEDELKERIYPRLRKVVIDFVGPNGEDVKLNTMNPFGWGTGADNSTLSGMNHPMGRYIEGAGAVLYELGYGGVTTHNDIDFKSNGTTVDVSRAIDFATFTSTAQAYDRVAKFFVGHAETLKQWKESLGEDTAAWKGKAAEVFHDLIDGLHKNYAGFADQMHPKGFSPKHQSKWDYYASSSRQGDAILGAGNTVHTAIRDLYQAWSDWESGTNVDWANLSMGKDAVEYLPGLASPYGILYSMLQSASLWAYNHNARFVVKAHHIGSKSTHTSGNSYGTDTWRDTQTSVRYYVMLYDAERFIPGLGWLHDVSTWAGLGDKAVTSWNKGVEEYLYPAAESALSNVNNAFVEARRVIDEVLKPEVTSYFGGTGGSGGYGGTGDDGGAQDAIDAAEKAAQDAIDKANQAIDDANAAAQAAIDKANQAVDDANAAAQAAIDEANQAVDDANAEADAAIDKANAAADEAIKNANDQANDANDAANKAINEANNQNQAIQDDANSQIGDANNQANEKADQANADAEAAIDKANAAANQAIEDANNQANGSNHTDGANNAIDAGHSQPGFPIGFPIGSPPPESDSTGNSRRRTDGVTTQNPDGSVTTTYSDGTKVTTDPNGKVTQKDPDGTVTVSHPDGSVTVTSPDGKVRSTGPGGNGSITTTPHDQTVVSGPSGKITVDPDGHTTVTGPSGRITTKPDGSTSIDGPHGSTTTSSDGRVTVTGPDGSKTVTSPDGSVQVTSPDGSVTTTYPDGTTSVIAPDGTTTVTTPDGSVQVTSPDGSVKVTYPDGSTVVRTADGTTTVTSPDGSTTVTSPNGSITTDNPHRPSDGTGNGTGNGSGHGTGNGTGNESGNGTGNGSGNGTGNGSGNNSSNGTGNGIGIGNGSGIEVDYPNGDSGHLSDLGSNGSSYGYGGESRSDGYAYDDAAAAASSGSGTGLDGSTSGNPFVQGDQSGSTAGALGNSQSNSNSNSASGNGSGGGSPMMPPMGGMRGGGGESPTERERSGPGPRISRTAMRRGSASSQAAERRRAAVTPDEELEEDVITTRSGTPFGPPMPPPAQRDQATQSAGDRERTAWVAEDEDVWGTDEGTTPAVIGR
ncbi:AAWKG family protein [Streptomyces sp. NPDC096311]|uniref:AAWKG family protein n=1 Tax=Streptomyces sp. NPDC096311 TaxID=3366083 RepID=UPI0037FFFE41